MKCHYSIPNISNGGGFFFVTDVVAGDFVADIWIEWDSKISLALIGIMSPLVSGVAHFCFPINNLKWEYINFIQFTDG